MLHNHPSVMLLPKLTHLHTCAGDGAAWTQISGGATQAGSSLIGSGQSAKADLICLVLAIFLEEA